MNPFLRILLFPFALIYGAITGLRNHLYNIEYSKSFRFETPVISVGNLSVGGSGKTPTVEYLVRLLKDRYRLATLSRGYGRSTKGFRIANESDDYKTIGDEPFQYYTKFGNEVVVSVGEERALAIPNILHERDKVQVILLDDAYQHRAVDPHFNILITDFDQPFYKDYIMPSGRLRESRNGARRADAIIVSKCPANLDESDEQSIIAEIRAYSQADCPIFFTRIGYENPEPVFARDISLDSAKVYGFSGIARNEVFKNHLSGQYELAGFSSFPDHHNYTAHELIGVLDKAKGLPIVTTEKDRVKLMRPEFREVLEQSSLFFIPIRHEFIRNGTQFDDLILKAIESD